MLDASRIYQKQKKQKANHPTQNEHFESYSSENAASSFTWPWAISADLCLNEQGK
jgi:hypothetical protein